MTLKELENYKVELENALDALKRTYRPDERQEVAHRFLSAFRGLLKRINDGGLNG